MNSSEIKWAVRSGLLAFTVVSSVQAQTVDLDRVEPIADLTERHSEIRLSLNHLSDPARRRGTYTGISEERSYLSADIDLQRFDPATGTLLRFSGRDLGLDQREALFDYSQQGQWRYMLGFSQTTRFEPYVVNTGVTGIGTASVRVPGTPASASIRPVDYSMARHLFTGGVDYTFDKSIGLRVRFTHETKDGERVYGRGNFGANSIEHLPEPVDRTTETLEIALSYVSKDLQLTGGYYGTLFANHANAIVINRVGAAVAPLDNAPAFTPMSQPLDNNSHQLFVTGGYNVTPKTRAMFKASQTLAQQNEELMAATGTPLAGAPASLKGKVETTLAYLDLTSLEVDRLDLQANIRYEDRNDKTPEAQYILQRFPNSSGTFGIPGTVSGQTGFNKPRSWQSIRTKFEAGYALPDNYKVLAGWEIDSQQRNAPELYRRVNFRTETEESGYRLELKKQVSETMTGSVAYSDLRRTGSAYIPATYDYDGVGNEASNASIDPRISKVNPLIWADRDRHIWKAILDWTPLEDVLVNLLHERSRDFYSGRDLGPRDGGRVYTAMDVSYRLSDRWNAHVWWSLDDTRADQAHQVNPANGQLWAAALRQLSEGMGVGIQGKTRSGIEVGVDFAFSDQTAEQRMTALTGSVNSLPDYYYRMIELRAFGVYPLNKQSGLRADYSFQDWRTNDWTWTGWQYSDGTTLTEERTQRNHLIGLSYYYRWR